MDKTHVGASREGLLERYHEAVGLAPIETEATAPTAEKVEASSDSAPIKSESDAQPKDEHTEAEPKANAAKEVVTPDPGVKKEEVERKKEEPKTVPLQALHEAREKLKAKTLESRELNEKLGAKDQELKAMNERIAALEKTIREAKGEEEPNTDDTVTLVEENKKLKETQAKLEDERRIKTKEDAERKTAQLISVADADLSKEGFPGFTQFGRNVYEAIVAKIQAGEMEEKDVTTDLWKQVYKEEVYPKIKSIFDPQMKQEKAAEKKALKEKANLVRNPGEGPTPKEEANLDAPQTPESYVKARKLIK